VELHARVLPELGRREDEGAPRRQVLDERDLQVAGVTAVAHLDVERVAGEVSLEASSLVRGAVAPGLARHARRILPWGGHA
jgi:GTP cyclohydrolase III